MSMGMTTTSTNVTISGTVASALPQPSTSQTVKQAYLSTQTITKDTPTVLLTVTAGKTFYCTGIWSYADTASMQNVLWEVNATPVIATIIGMGATGQGQCVLSGGILFTATAGQTVGVDITATTIKCSVAIWGYEA